MAQLNGKGHFDCRLKQSYDATVKDGESEEYHGRRSFYKPNAEIKIEYGYYGLSKDPRFSLKSEGFDNPFSFRSYLKKPLEIPEDISFYVSNEKNLIGVSLNGTYNIISEDFISLKSILGTIRMFRYFKNDWQVVVNIMTYHNEGRDIYTSVKVFDCRHTENIFDKMFTELRGKGY